MQFESLFRSALSNQSLRYTKNQFHSSSGLSVFRDSAKSARMTA